MRCIPGLPALRKFLLRQDGPTSLNITTENFEDDGRVVPAEFLDVRCHSIMGVVTLALSASDAEEPGDVGGGEVARGMFG